MKKTFLILLSFLIFSCSKKIDCNGSDEKELLIEMLSENFENIYTQFKNKNEQNIVYNLDFKELKSRFFTEMIKFETVKNDKADGKLSGCDCEATIMAELPKDIIDYINENLQTYDSLNLDDMTEKFNFKTFRYNIEQQESDKSYCDISQKEMLENAFKNYAYYTNLIQNHKDGTLKKTLTNAEAEHGIDWLRYIFVCETSDGTFCFPVEENVCSKRFFKFMIEKGNIYGPSNYTEEERIIAEKKYKQNWFKTYTILEDDNWLFGRGNGDVEGLPLKSVTIEPIDDLNFEVDIDYDGEIKTKNYVTLVKAGNSYLIDFCETVFL